MTWNVVKLFAQSPGGTVFMGDQTSYDNYDGTLGYGETATYEYET